MTTDFINTFQGEWLKMKGSHASWLIIVGSLFTPAVVIAIRLLHHDALQQLYEKPRFWALLWNDSWESMAVFFLPMAAILATCLITQIEYKNNAWKQVHTMPLSPAILYFSKLLVIVLMLMQFLLLFDLGILLSGLIPYLLTASVPFPEPLPLRFVLGQNGLYFIDGLPIIAAQYALSLRSKTFVLPIGIGFLAWVAALAALSSRYGHIVPYAYSLIEYMKDAPSKRPPLPAMDFHWYALGYSFLFTVVGYCLFAHQDHRG